MERLREENHTLQMSVHKHEKLLYGSMTSVAPRGTLMRAVPGRASSPSVPPTPTRSRTPTPRGTPLSSAHNTPARERGSGHTSHHHAPSPGGVSGFIAGGIAGGLSGIISTGSGSHLGAISSTGGMSDAARVYLEHDKEKASLAVAKSFVHSMEAIDKQKKKKAACGKAKAKPTVRGTFGTGSRFK